MNSKLRNILAGIVGFIIGSVINMLIIHYGNTIIPVPKGVDNSSMENFKVTFHLLKPINFLIPFLAHALGTLIGAYIAVKICVSHHLKLAMIISVLFFIGGFIMVMSLPAPIWFNITDLVLAYFPMGYLGYLIAKPKQ